jgi:hypothetical protein
MQYSGNVSCYNRRLSGARLERLNALTPKTLSPGAFIHEIRRRMLLPED